MAVVVRDATVAVAAAAAAGANGERLTVRSFFLQWDAQQLHLRDLLAHAQDSPAELQHIALHSLRLEEAVASGCLMIQALVLVRLWTLRNNVQQITPHHSRLIHTWCQFTECTHTCGSHCTLFFAEVG